MQSGKRRPAALTHEIKTRYPVPQRRHQPDTESGLGDASLLANFTPVRTEHMHSTFNWNIFGDVKFPTDANDLTWRGGPGVFFVLRESWTNSLQFIISGEDKGLDEFAGEKAADTGITSVYLGPQLNLIWSDKLSAQAGVDLPVLQAVPDYRVRTAFNYRF